MTSAVQKILAAGLCIVIFAQAQESYDTAVVFHPRDSFHVHIPSAFHRKATDGGMILTVAWSLYRKPFIEEESTYGDWMPLDLRKANLLYGVYCATDSEFQDVVSAGTTSAGFFTLKNLEFGKHYFYRVDILDVGRSFKTDIAQATIFDIPPELSPWQNPWRFWKWLWAGVAFIFAGLWLMTLGILLSKKLRPNKDDNREIN